MDGLAAESKSEAPLTATSEKLDAMQYLEQLSQGPSVQSRNFSTGKTETWMIDNYDVEQAMREFSQKLEHEAKQAVKVVGKRDKAEYDRLVKLRFQQKFQEHLVQTGRVKPGFVKWISEDGGVEVDGMYGSGTAETGWLPPNTITIDDRRKRQIILEAKAPACCVKGPPQNPRCCGKDVGENGLLSTVLCIRCRPCHSSPDTHIAAGGIGTMLYFRLQKTLLVAFAMASLLMLPAVFFTSQGSRIRDDQMDLLQLSAYSIANIGNEPDAEFTTYTFLNSMQRDYSWSLAAVRLQEASSQQAALAPASKFYSVPGIGEVGAGAALTAVGFLDALAALVFLSMIAIYYNMVKLKANVPGAHRKVLLQDYSVKVTGVPPNVTAEQIRQHFSKLYALDQPDWRTEHWWRYLWGVRSEFDHDPYGKPGQRKHNTLAPDSWGVVHETRNARNLSQPVSNIEHLHQRYTQQEAEQFLHGWVADVQLVEALGEMHSRYSGYAGLEQELLQRKARMMKFHPSSQYHNEVKYKKAKAAVAQMDAKLVQAKQSIIAAHQTDTSAVFVVFNNNESKLRCLDDYAGSTSYFWWGAQPLQLRLRTGGALSGSAARLVVEQAADPTDILWENLEFRHDERNVRSAWVCFCTLLVLLISVVCLSFGENLENQLGELVPDQELCKLQIPAAATGSYNTLNLGLRLLRSPELETDECSPGQFYVSVLSDTQPDDSRGAPDTCFGNCIDPQDSRVCVLGAGIKDGTVERQAMAANQNILPEYSAADLAACTCMDMIRRSTSDGLVGGPQELLLKHGVMCGDLVSLFLQSRGLVIFAGMALVAVNTVLEKVIVVLNDFQKHPDRSGARYSLLIKIFMAQFVNTALVVLLVNSSLPLFGGDFSDFTLGWHVEVGAQMMTALFMNMLGSHAIVVLDCVFWQPVRRYWLLTKENHSQLTPQGLLKQVAPPPFHLESKYASMLSNVGVILMFSTAYPILYVLGLITMTVSFYAEKLLVLKFYKKPESSDPRQAEFAARCMKLIVFMHAAVGFWMLGADGVVQHQWFGPDHVWQTAGDQSTVDETGQQQQQQNTAGGSNNYQTPSTAAKAERDSAVAVGQLASALKEWDLHPAWDSLGLVPRIAAIAGIGLGILSTTFLVGICWRSPICLKARYAWQVCQAQDVCACEASTEDDDSVTTDKKKSPSTVTSTYETTKGEKLEVKATKAQQATIFTSTARLLPPFTGSFYRMLPPINKQQPKPSLPTRACIRIDFKLPCAQVCYSEREMRHARRWARQQEVLARKTTNRFANKLKDSSSDGDMESQSQAVQLAVVAGPAITKSATPSRTKHFNLGEVQGLPLWRPFKGHKISKGQKAAGWLLIKDKLRHPNAVQRVRDWNDAKVLAEAQAANTARHSARPGEHYTTWEIIATYGLHSYDIGTNPHYAGFVRLLREARTLRQAVSDGKDTVFAFEPRQTRKDRVIKTLHNSTLAYVTAAHEAAEALLDALCRWYISMRGGDPNAAEQASAVMDDDLEDGNEQIMSSDSFSFLSKAARGHSHAAKAVDAATAPPEENYEMYLARRNPQNARMNRLIQKGYRRVRANQPKASVAPALALGVLAERSEESPRAPNPTDPGPAVPENQQPTQDLHEAQ